MRNLTSFVVVVAVVVSGRANADPKSEANDHKQKAGAAFKEGRLNDALDELTAAEALDPDPALLYAIGQVHVKLDQCTEAIDFYKQYLETHPPADKADLANQAVETCKEQLAAAASAAPVTPVAPTAPVVDVEAPPVHVDSPAWYSQDPLGESLVVGGGVTAIVGIVLYVSARGTNSDAATASTYGAGLSDINSASSLRTASAILMIGGAALAGLGVYHYMQHDDDQGVAVVPTHGGAVVGWSSRF